ncbi:MAG: lipopolysaccharide heptosyltransferase II [Planctomycetes bacterium]|nr:lipopolysaccharide heptosyltransferase II [Planctomycetota bacterium]
MRVAVFLPNWIGDVVMATPAIRALRKLVGPDGQLIGLMRPYVADVLAGTSWLDAQIIYGKPPSRFRVAAPEVYQQLRAERLDRAVLLTNSMRTAWIAWRSGARERIGYAGEGRSWLLTKRVPPRAKSDGVPLSTIDGYMRLTEAAGCEPEPPRLELFTTPADERAADAVWQQLKLPPGNEVVILNSGGAYGAAKLWPAEYFAELARRIVDRRGEKLSVLVNCGPAEREIAREVAARAGSSRAVSLADVEKLPIGLTKACVRRARMLVTTDSGPRFLAIAFGKPVVTLFGPTDPAATATHYEREMSLSLALDCQPCMERTCPLVHHRCMRDLTVDQVYAAVVDGLDAA